VTGTETFEADIGKFAKLLELRVNTVLQRLALDIMGRIILRTPVDTGRARSSWDLSIGAPSEWVPPEREGKGKKIVAGQTFTMSANAGSSVDSKAFATAKDITATQPVFIVSNLDYIEALENGHSKQAPVGMVVISLAEVEAEIELLLEKAIAETPNP
jgi:hypothetical protein